MPRAHRNWIPTHEPARPPQRIDRVTGYAMNDGNIYAAKEFADGDRWSSIFEPGDPRLPEFTVAAALAYARAQE